MTTRTLAAIIAALSLTGAVGVATVAVSSSSAQPFSAPPTQAPPAPALPAPALPAPALPNISYPNGAVHAMPAQGTSFYQDANQASASSSPAPHTPSPLTCRSGRASGPTMSRTPPQHVPQPPGLASPTLRQSTPVAVAGAVAGAGAAIDSERLASQPAGADD